MLMKKIDFVTVSGNSTFHSRTRSGKQYSYDILSKYKFSVPRKAKCNQLLLFDDFKMKEETSNNSECNSIDDDLLYKTLEHFEASAKEDQPTSTQNIVTPTITVEARQRIEHNRMIALQKLQQKKRIEESRSKALEKLKQKKKAALFANGYGWTQQLRIRESFNRAKAKLQKSTTRTNVSL